MASARRSSALVAVALALWAGAAPAPAAAEGPGRVVSMNLCTDQLAMLLAAPGQLVSVSWLARDDRSSAMAEQAADWPVNHGQAEEIFLLRPDLVLAGQYTGQATVSLLQRLGVPVAIFPPETGLADVEANILAMGRALGREPQAQAMAARFRADLAALRVGDGGDRPRAALFYANGYTTGDRTLAGEILAAAGFGTAVAMPGGGVLPLEQLVMADPDLVVRGRPYPGASRSEAVLDHPALRELVSRRPVQVLADRDWVCGTPHVLRAVTAMALARRALGGR